MEAKKWVFPPEELPDSMTWPTWGALRERILTACTEILADAYHVPEEVPKLEREGWNTRMDSVSDYFISELVKISPPALALIRFNGCPNLRHVVMSPKDACPSLTTLDLARCDGLESVLIQSQTIENIKLSLCGNLKSVILHCPKLIKLDLRECLSLERILIWSDVLGSLSIPECRQMKSIELHCPSMGSDYPVIGRMVTDPRARKTHHTPVAAMMAAQYTEEYNHEEMIRKALKARDMDMVPVPRTFATL